MNIRSQPPKSQTSVRIGILHSLTGTMASSEKPLVDAALMAVEELNAGGGVLGRPVEPTVFDGCSDPGEFQSAAKKLVHAYGVESLFGCWNSSARKAVQEVVESTDSLLWYPIQYEGLEQSGHIVYTGSCLNQQIEPAIRWAFSKGFRRCMLIGSKYVFPTTANSLIRALVEELGGEVLDEQYLPLGSTEFFSHVAKVVEFKPDIIFNTVNGSSNIALFSALDTAGVSAEESPVMSFSIGEVEQEALVHQAAGNYACWSYFQSLESAANKGFVERYRARYGAGRVTSDPIVTAYAQVHFWARAVEAAGSAEPERVREVLAGIEYEGPGGLLRVRDNNHVCRPALIGRALRGGGFEIVWESPEAIEPLPWLGMEQVEMPAKNMVLAALRLYPEAVHHADELAKALSEIKTLRGMLPICATCKKIRDLQGQWKGIETYVQSRTNATFSHGYCPTCADALIEDFDAERSGRSGPS